MCVCVCLLGMSEPACRSEAERVEAQSGAPRGACWLSGPGGHGRSGPGRCRRTGGGAETRWEAAVAVSLPRWFPPAGGCSRSPV